MYPNLKKLRHHRLTFFAYPLSGGVEHSSLVPTWMVRPVLAFKRVLGTLSRYLALRTLIVLEKGIQIPPHYTNEMNQTNQMNQCREQ
jgi:hypothetical protein